MKFCNNFVTANIIGSSDNIENVLNQVTKSISHTNTSQPHSVLGQKVQNGDTHHRQPQASLQILKQQPSDPMDPMPTYTNYWLAQSDPDYVNQEQHDTQIPRMRKRSTPSLLAKGVKESIGANMSDHELSRVLQDRFPNYNIDHSRQRRSSCGQIAMTGDLLSMGLGPSTGMGGRPTNPFW